MEKSPLAGVLNDAVVRRLAKEPGYSQGLDYFAYGHVERLVERSGRIRAVVRGNQRHTVELSAEDGMLDYSCDCPEGEQGDFCKHCAAVAVGWLAQGRKSKRGASKPLTLADAPAILQQEDQRELVRLMLEWADADTGIRDRLVRFISSRSSPQAGAAAMAQAFKKSISLRRYLTRREMPKWAKGVNTAVNEVERMLEQGSPAAVIGICESALELLVEVRPRVDDTDSHFSILRDRLEDIHHRACLEAPPDPSDFAGRLFRAELEGGREVFQNGGERYAYILGPEGLKSYRALAEQVWAKYPDSAKRDRMVDREYYKIAPIMESIARAEGDLDKSVEVMRRDLSAPFRYWKIASLLRAAGRHQDALSWAERGLAAFKSADDAGLAEFAKEEYQRLGRVGDAIALSWSGFVRTPSLAAFRDVQLQSEANGSWEAWRGKALALLKTRIAAVSPVRKIPRIQWRDPAQDQSILVEILVSEGLHEEAWHEATENGCSRRLWADLAVARAVAHPDDASRVFLALAEHALGVISIEDAVEYLVHAGRAMRLMGQGDQFQIRLQELRKAHFAKLDFRDLLESASEQLNGDPAP